MFLSNYVLFQNNCQIFPWHQNGFNLLVRIFLMPGSQRFSLYPSLGISNLHLITPYEVKEVITNTTNKKPHRHTTLGLSLLLGLGVNALAACGAEPEKQIVLPAKKPQPKTTFSLVSFQSGMESDIWKFRIQSTESIDPTNLEQHVRVVLCYRSCVESDIAAGREPIPTLVDTIIDLLPLEKGGTDNKIIEIRQAKVVPYLSGRVYKVIVDAGIQSIDGMLKIDRGYTAYRTIVPFATYLNGLLAAGRVFNFSWPGGITNCAKSQMQIRQGANISEAYVDCTGLLNHEPPQSNLVNARFMAGAMQQENLLRGYSQGSSMLDITGTISP